MKETLQFRGCILMLGLTLVIAGLTACSPPAEEPAPQAVPAISGKQLDNMRQRVQESDLFKSAKPIWTSLNWVKDTRIVIHSRIDGLEDPELADSFCQRATDFILADLLPGQSFDLYLVGAKDVYACN